MQKNNSYTKVNSTFLNLFVLSLIIFINCILLYWVHTRDKYKVDLFTLWAVPQVIAAKNIDNIYSKIGQRELGHEIINQTKSPDVPRWQKRFSAQVVNFYKGRIDSTATPFLYSLTAIFAKTPDYNSVRIGFNIFTFICFAFSIFLLCRMTGFSMIYSFLIFSIFSSFFTPVISDLGVGNLSQIQLFILTSYIFFAKSDNFLSIIFSGVILGFGIVLKPNILMVLVLAIILYLFSAYFKKLLSLIIGVISACAVCVWYGSSYFGNYSIWYKFLESLRKTLDLSYPIEHGNFSFVSLLYYFTKKNFSFAVLLITLIIFLILVLISLKKSSLCPDETVIKNEHREKNLTEAFSIVGIGCLIMLLSAPLAWIHYYVLLIPIIIFLFRPAINSFYKKQTMFIQTFAVISVLLFNIINGLLIGFMPITQCIIVNVATILIYFSSLFVLWRGRYC